MKRAMINPRAASVQADNEPPVWKANDRAPVQFPFQKNFDSFTEIKFWNILVNFLEPN